ncbi:MAG TPA: DRTGG domain-containing protein [Dehalococcoidia bacterium]|nr:DRTGG domain-containing protein [Dehalococcoidia bacterium]
MPILVVASAEPGVGRSLVAAALAYRLGREGRAVTLARLTGDAGADADATTFSRLDGIVAPVAPVEQAQVASLSGDVILEAPAGNVDGLVRALDARVLVVGGPASAMDVGAPPGRVAGHVLTNVPLHAVPTVAQRAAVVAVLPEDRVLAAPSIADIAAALRAEWLIQQGAPGGIERVMIGTVASDAASPYFGNRERTCVVTRFDKTDIQLAALLTDVECMVITGGGRPSPYLLDRVRGTRDDVAVLLAPENTVETMRVIEGLYGRSRFDGMVKLERAVALLDEAGVAVSF